MADDKTPLLPRPRSRPRRRPKHPPGDIPYIAIAAVFICGGIYACYVTLSNLHRSEHVGGHWHRYRRGGRDRYWHGDYDDVRRVILDTPDPERIREWVGYYTDGPHMTGQNLSQAQWTRDKWEEWGVGSHIASYDVYLNYPLDHSLSLLEATTDSTFNNNNNDDDDDDTNWTVLFSPPLQEDVLPQDPSTSSPHRIPTFHGYSANGNVTAPYVYVNYGSYLDFNDLVRANVSLEGKIALARYDGGVFRGLKVRRAQQLGMVGMLLYTDPGDDGPIREDNGYAAYPDGPARNPSSVQRGSVDYISFLAGDPTTPGYPSLPGAPRQDPHELDLIPKIPTLPISYADAIPLLKALHGHGPKAEDMGEWWTRNTGLGYKGVEYRIGPSPPSLVINLYNSQNYTTTPLWDVIGVINGTGPAEEVVIVGCHRDSWTVGGVGDPNGGSAALNEVVRAFGRALELGWQPRRTIVFASWDGEEHALLGSTEWLEDHVPWLTGAAVAYIQTDVIAAGSSLGVHAAPLLHSLINDVARQVPSPNQTVPGQTVWDLWDKKIGVMGSGSDFVAFQDFVGIPSVDLGFRRNNKNGPVWHYHSNYDSPEWMEKYGDPGLFHHRAGAQLLGLLTLGVADAPVIPFRAKDYANALGEYLERVEKKLSTSIDGFVPLDTDDDEEELLQATLRPTNSEPHGNHTAFESSLELVKTANAHFIAAAAAFDAAALQLQLQSATVPWWDVARRHRVRRALRRANTRYKLLERRFTHPAGLDGRETFKHVVFAPGLWTGYAGAVFPGLVESIDVQDWENGVRWAGIVKGCIENATSWLVEG